MTDVSDRARANGMIVRRRAIYFFEDDKPIGRMAYGWNGINITPRQVYHTTQNHIKPWRRTNMQEGLSEIIGEGVRGNMGIKWENPKLTQRFQQTAFMRSLEEC